MQGEVGQCRRAAAWIASDVLRWLVTPHFGNARLTRPPRGPAPTFLNGANSEYKFKEGGDLLIGTEMDEIRVKLPSDSKVKLFPKDA